MRSTTLLLTALLAACGDNAPTARDADSLADTDVTDTSRDGEEVGPDADTAETGDTPSPGEGLAATVAALCPGYAEAFCGAACGCADAPGFPEDCVAAFTGSCAAQVERFAPLVERGEAVFLPGGAATCLENFAPLAAACVPFPEDLFYFVCPIIEPPGGFPPLPGLGEPCEGACASGLRCGTEGKCLSPGGTGASCVSAYDCAMNLVCADGQCVAPRLGDRGKACTRQDECGGETVCLASARKVCRVPVAGPCRSDEDCPDHAWCDGLVEGGECKPGGASGELCGNGIVCQEGLACSSADGRCGPFPGRGEPCAMGRFGPFLCADGLACRDDVTCGDVPGEGQTCALGKPACADGLGCAFTPEGSVCRVKADAGATCENDDTCRDDLFCDFGSNTCTPFLAKGELCTDGNECGPVGSCLPDASFVFRCADKPGVGGECFLDDCQAGLVCRTPYEAGMCAPVLCSMMRF